MPFSHHSHSGQFCGHAKNTLEEIVQGAVKKEMRVLALTEHMPREQGDLYPEEVKQTSFVCSFFFSFSFFFFFFSRFRSSTKSLD